MNTDQMTPEPMTEDQLEYIKNEIKKTYLTLISYTEHDPKLIDFIKLSALADVQKKIRGPGALVISRI